MSNGAAVNLAKQCMSLPCATSLMCESTSAVYSAMDRLPQTGKYCHLQNAISSKFV
jgi:hypothetical protein